MLALSDTQGLDYLMFGESVGFECARRIFEVVKAVKRRPVEFFCLLTDIINPNDRRFSETELALILGTVTQAMVFMDEESITPLLLPMASGMQSIQLTAASERWRDRILHERVTGEAPRICGILQAKYAALFVSSTAQLQVLSCVRSAAVAQPAMGWLRMHEPL
jgi:hypothetical protein